MSNKKEVMKALEDVYDPEIGVDIVTLGLIYDVSINSEGDVHVLMTFTFPGCPYGPQLEEEVKDAIKELKNVRNTKVEITFEPAWTPDKIDPDVRAALGF
ncbi:metal-sulfur cluster assembly factor [Candidatus Woesearchaeota archaeon]|nr:metal-sulfur cluster assembly factor [Candidatus Woesearchaeota archaeon]MCF8012868.1 metal-sulfur cluster assembly factor [Candidatus Woesearchaeota archaeon]